MTNKNEKPENILITGASSGIGAALAKHYARPGAHLFLGGRDPERLDGTSRACREKGADVTAIAVDVTDRSAMAAWITASDDTRPLDLVIANAGISGGTGGGAVLHGESAAQVRKIFAVNLDGVLNTIEPVLPRMMERRRGQIALMSSLAGFSGWPGAPSYSASKGAVRLYGEALRGALAGSGVRVSVICPGFIRTPMTAVNDYKMPFMLDVGKAASVIAAGLARNRGRIAFPPGTYFLAGLLGILPYDLSSALMKKLPEKPAQLL